MKLSTVFRKAAKRIGNRDSDCCCYAIQGVCYAHHYSPYALQLASLETHAAGFFSRLFSPYRNHPSAFWWSLSLDPKREHECITPRIIALELCALIAEEQGL